MGQLILITGACGFIGRRLIPTLREAGHRLLITDRLEAPPPGLESAGRYVRADLSDPESLETLEGEVFDAVAHLAALPILQDGEAQRRDMYQANVTATWRLLEIAARRKARFCFASTGMVYGDQPGPFREDMETRPGNFYALTKVLGEEMLRAYARQYGFPHLIFRTAIVYGPEQAPTMFLPSILEALAQGREFPMTEGKQVRDFIHVDDWCRALATALERNLEGTYNLGSGSPRTMSEVADLAGELTGQAEKIRRGALPYRPNELWQYYVDMGKFLAVSGWRPEIDLRRGMQEVLRHAQKKG